MRACDEISYDGEADALYIGLACEWASRSVHVSTIAAPGGVNVDVVEGVPVGIEVLAASKHPVFSQLVPLMDGRPVQQYTAGGVHPPAQLREAE